MAASQGALPPKMPDLVAHSKIDTTFDHNGETKHSRSAIGSSSLQRKQKVIERWKRKRTLGSGSFGTVWLEERIQEGADQQLRAVKEIHKGPNNPSLADVYRELETIAKFSHDRFAHCFVRSFGWYESEARLFIAMEYLKHGDLQRYLSHPFPEPEGRQIAKQIVEGLQFMHENGFAHRDLKPGNVLVMHRGPAWWVKIADFGISKRMEGSTVLRTLQIGTMGYMAPELIGLYCPEDLDDDQSEYTTAVDIWALGQITHIMLTNQLVLHEPKQPKQLFNYMIKAAAFPKAVLEAAGTSESGRDFIERLMAASANKRLTAGGAIKHRWLDTHEVIEETENNSDSAEYGPGKTLSNYSGAASSAASAQWSTLPLNVESPTGRRDERLETIVPPMKGLALVDDPWEDVQTQPGEIGGSSAATKNPQVTKQSGTGHGDHRITHRPAHTSHPSGLPAQSSFIGREPSLGGTAVVASELRQEDLLAKRMKREAMLERRFLPSTNQSSRDDPLWAPDKIPRGVPPIRMPPGRAKWLCVLRNPESQSLSGVDIVSVESFGSVGVPPYLYVDYDADEFSINSPDDLGLLHSIAERACREVKLPRYWIAASCLRDGEDMMRDVWIKNDIVLAGHKTVVIMRANIASYPEDADFFSRQSAFGRRLCRWGERLWSIPVFLATLTAGEVRLYFVPNYSYNPDEVIRVNIKSPDLASLIYPGYLPVTRLVSHAAGVSILSQIERIVCIMKLLATIKTTKSLPRDYYYMLMSFCPYRAVPDRSDTPFEAFVRLFLVNEQMGFLERWLCSDWKIRSKIIQIMDPWGVEIGNIHPLYRVTGLETGDYLLLDGVSGDDIYFINPANPVVHIFGLFLSASSYGNRFFLLKGKKTVEELSREPSLILRGSKGKDLHVSSTIQYTHHDKPNYWTLVDALAKSVTYFHAEVPVRNIFFVGEEGGMVRGILCSSQSKGLFTTVGSRPTNRRLGYTPEDAAVFFRETVVRFKGGGTEGKYVNAIKLAPYSWSRRHDMAPSNSGASSSRHIADPRVIQQGRRER